MEGYFLDANLLVLLVVGSENRELISKHRRLEDFTVDDFDILAEFLSTADQLYVTPNTLTETSNLVRQHGDPERTLLMGRLHYLIQQSREIVVASIDASYNYNFASLGLTDAVLLESVTIEKPLLTVDLDLYLAALASGEERAINLNHQRNL